MRKIILAAAVVAAPLSAQSITKSATIRMGGPAAQIQAQHDGFGVVDPMSVRSSVAGAYAKIPAAASAGAGREKDANTQHADPVAVGSAASNTPISLQPRY
jgi:hypothetical protein